MLDLAFAGVQISLGIRFIREGAGLVSGFVMAGAKADVDAETGDGGGAGGGSSGGSFSEQRLIDKLNRLNNSATSIQSILSSLFTSLVYFSECSQIW